MFNALVVQLKQSVTCRLREDVGQGGRPKMPWKVLAERDRREWKLSEFDPGDRDVWRSAMRGVSQLPGRGSTDVDDTPIPARKLRLYDHPYSGVQKVLQFPYRHIFSYGLFVRYVCVGFALMVPICLFAQRLANAPANKIKWKEIRHARTYTHFEPPMAIEYPKQPGHWW